MAGFITVTLDDVTLNTIARLQQFPGMVEEAISSALEEGAAQVADDAEKNTWGAFANPTGELAGSIEDDLIDSLTAEVTVNVPYSRRLEFGFGPGGAAATDSLGRTYHNKPEPYAEPALVSNVDVILEMINDNISDLYAQMGMP